MSIKSWNFKHTPKGHVWEALDAAGDIIGKSSQAFSSRRSAEYNANLLGMDGTTSKQLVWDIYNTASGWMWKADNSVNKENVARSHTAFNTKSEAQENASFFGYPYTLNTNGTRKEHNQYASYAMNDMEENTIGSAGGWWKWLIGLLSLALLLFLLWPFLFNGKNTTSSSTASSSSTATVSQPSSVVPSSSSSISSAPAVATYVAGNFLEKLSKDGNYTLFLKAVDAAGLRSKLDGPGPFTVFAPNDTAMRSLGSTLDDLLKPENKLQLEQVINYHVVNGWNGFQAFRDKKTLTTLNGQNVTLGIGPQWAFVQGVKNRATAPVEDINTTNAVIHVLTQEVLLP